MKLAYNKHVHLEAGILVEGLLVGTFSALEPFTRSNSNFQSNNSCCAFDTKYTILYYLVHITNLFASLIDNLLYLFFYILIFKSCSNN